MQPVDHPFRKLRHAPASLFARRSLATTLQPLGGQSGRVPAFPGVSIEATERT